MKLVMTAFLITLAIIANAQDTLVRSISNDGRTMHLKVRVNRADAKIRYDESFDISKMSKAGVDTLIEKVVEGLGVTKYLQASLNEIKENTKEATATDKQQIERAILNYVEGVYEADTARIYESVAPFLAKRGYFMRNDELREGTMTFAQLVALTKSWSKTQKITAESPRKVTVFDILDKTASAKVEAQWGVDYFHLAKLNGKWTIINVLWQDYPKK